MPDAGARSKNVSVSLHAAAAAAEDLLLVREATDIDGASVSLYLCLLLSLLLRCYHICWFSSSSSSSSIWVFLVLFVSNNRTCIILLMLLMFGDSRAQRQSL